MSCVFSLRSLTSEAFSSFLRTLEAVFSPSSLKYCKLLLPGLLTLTFPNVNQAAPMRTTTTRTMKKTERQATTPTKSRSRTRTSTTTRKPTSR